MRRVLLVVLLGVCFGLLAGCVEEDPNARYGFGREDVIEKIDPGFNTRAGSLMQW